MDTVFFQKALARPRRLGLVEERIRQAFCAHTELFALMLPFLTKPGVAGNMHFDHCCAVQLLLEYDSSLRGLGLNEFLLWKKLRIFLGKFVEFEGGYIKPDKVYACCDGKITGVLSAE